MKHPMESNTRPPVMFGSWAPRGIHLTYCAKEAIQQQQSNAAIFNLVETPGLIYHILPLLWPQTPSPTHSRDLIALVSLHKNFTAQSHCRIKNNGIITNSKTVIVCMESRKTVWKKTRQCNELNCFFFHWWVRGK
jgi:hypothetical protein